jgi:hypothetical protein
MLCALGFHAAAQDIFLCRQVVSSSGKTAIRDGVTYMYTIGEPVVFLGLSPDYQLTQGFHQPEVCTMYPVGTLDLSLWGLEVFPNPASDNLTIRYSPLMDGDLRASVFDISGRPVLFRQPITSADGNTLDCSQWQAGVYFIRFEEMGSRAYSTTRIIKL